MNSHYSTKKQLSLMIKRNAKISLIRQGRALSTITSLEHYGLYYVHAIQYTDIHIVLIENWPNSTSVQFGRRKICTVIDSL